MAAMPAIRLVTLFPEAVQGYLTSSIVGRARRRGLADIEAVDPRQWAEGRHKKCDDRPFGGGPGMVMLAEPLFQCLSAIRADRQENEPAPLVLFSPMGQSLNHSAVAKWSASAGAVLLCGRYEGVDQRFIDQYVDQQISLGDFVLSGGEIAAMALLDAVARLQPGVLNDEGSHQQDSFNPALDGLLDSPHYTRPEVWHGKTVPEVLLSGHHARIERWRREQSLVLSARHRHELIDQARAAGRLSQADEDFIQSLDPRTPKP